MALAALHCVNGYGPVQSVTGVYHDVRVVITCPTNPSAIWHFMDRDPGEAFAHLFSDRGEGQDLKEYVYSSYCNTYPIED